MIEYYSIVNDEKHFRRILKHLKEQGSTRKFVSWDIFEKHNQNHPHAMFYNEKDQYTGYSSVSFGQRDQRGYIRKDICIDILPEDMFRL